MEPGKQEGFCRSCSSCRELRPCRARQDPTTWLCGPSGRTLGAWLRSAAFGASHDGLAVPLVARARQGRGIPGLAAWVGGAGREGGRANGYCGGRRHQVTMTSPHAAS
jgi:hypothetical protein